MDELELVVQRHVVNFCKILPVHVEKWRTILSNTEKPANALLNYAEQLRHVEKCDIKYIDGFSTLQADLQYKILSEIEDEISTLSGYLEDLNKINHETKNKLSVLERSTMDLNWENKCPLITGSALQPPLSRILEDGLNFWLYFAKALKSINENFKTFNVRHKKSMDCLKDSLKVNLEEPIINNLLAITQYVNNEKLLV